MTLPSSNLSSVPLNATTVMWLAKLIQARDCQRIRIQRNPQVDAILDATIREITPFNGRENTGAQDIRDQFLHLSSMVEIWLPVSEVVAALEGRTAFIQPSEIPASSARVQQ